MEERIEKKLRAFLPYIIIIGIAYLVLPILIFTGSEAISYIILVGVLPLTALLCCAHYSMTKENDFFLSLLAPLFFLPAMFIYPVASDSLLKAVIFLVAYFLCGYLGLTVGDTLAGRPDRSKTPEVPDKKTVTPHRVSRHAYRPEPMPAAFDENDVIPSSDVPRRVDLEAEQRPIAAADPYDDLSLDTSTTEADIDAILNEIHNRRSAE